MMTSRTTMEVLVEHEMALRAALGGDCAALAPADTANLTAISVETTDRCWALAVLGSRALSRRPH
jgi:hypothetical protein